MNAQQLQLADGTKISAWRCSTCGLVYSEKEPYSSERCCKCGDCGGVIDPKVTGGRSTICQACWGPHYAKLDADRLERAVEVSDYEGPVVIGDQYWSTLTDMLDERDGEDVPEFVHTCHVHHYQLDADDIIDNLLENSEVEDADSGMLSGVEELRAAIAAFNAKNSGEGASEYWGEDSKHKVRVMTVANVD